MPRVPDFGGHGPLRQGSSSFWLAARVLTLCLALGIGESLTTPGTHPLLAQLSACASSVQQSLLPRGLVSAWTWKTFILYAVERILPPSSPIPVLTWGEKLLRGGSSLCFPASRSARLPAVTSAGDVD